MRASKNGDKGRVEPFELVIDARIYEKLKQAAENKGITQEQALVEALERGMQDYWLHVAVEDNEVYNFIMNIYRQYQNDNKVLEELIAQNNRLYEILEQSGTDNKETGEEK